MFTVFKPKIIRRPCVKEHGIKGTTESFMCMGGFCELPNKPKHKNRKTFLSNGEGKSPPLKIIHKDETFSYSVSYPDDDLVVLETYTPLMITWMGRRWYACP